MYRMLIVLSLFLLLGSRGFGVIHTVTNSGFSFSPDSVKITLGDTVSFVLASIHNAREVSQATWNANGGTSNGGFETAFGGGDVVPTQSGTYYYVCASHFTSGMKGRIIVLPVTGVHNETASVPYEFVLLQNTPNPFNPTTTIRYALPVESRVSMVVYNLLGQSVAVLADDMEQAGYHEVVWNASVVPSGSYFLKLEATGPAGSGKSFTSVRKMMLLK